MKQITSSVSGVGTTGAQGILVGRRLVTGVSVLSAITLITLAFLLGSALVKPLMAREPVSVAGSPVAETGTNLASTYAPSCEAAVAVRSAPDSELANWYLAQAGNKAESLAIRCMGW